jgi:hypothetical protein
MALEMKQRCERCGVELPALSENAVICSHECTFCSSCSEELLHECPNCGGELLRRPRRRAG